MATIAASQAEVPLPVLLGNPQLAAWLESRLAARHGWAVRASSRSARLRVTGAAHAVTVAAEARRALAAYGLRAPAGAAAATRKRVSSARGEIAGAAGRPRRRPAAPPASDGDAVAHHALPLAELWRQVASTPHGLSCAEAALRLTRDGRNELADLVGRSSAQILISQFTTLPMGLLAAAAGLAWSTRARGETAAIAAVMVLNAALGFATEQHAERSVAGLRRLTPGRCRVLRDGVVHDIAAAEVVVGDVLLLTAGEPVVADARVIEAHRLAVNEAPLTGESLPVRKTADAVLPAATALAERRNLVHLGSLVAEGHGRAVVVATAAQSMLGLIRDLAQSAEAPRTRLQQDLDRLGSVLALAAGAVCAGMFLLGLVRGRPLWPLLRSAVSLGVAAIPEGLATVATSLMATTIQRLRRQRVYARSLEVLESLGGVDVVCVDKTGTLTRNTMRVGVVSTEQRLLVRSERKRLPRAFATLPPALLEVAALCNDAERSDRGAGSSTERALLELAERAGLDVAALRRRWPMQAAKRRSEQYAYMLTLHRGRRGAVRVAAKGNPSEVLARCSHRLWRGQRIALDAAARRAILAENEALAADGFRMLGLAERHQAEPEWGTKDGFTWLGLIGLSDPLRERMPETIARFHAAGIRVLVITGDQRGTARAVASAVGLKNGHAVLDASALEHDAEALAARLLRAAGVARATPAAKLAVVRALQRRGHVVAMLGDGINDGPALRAADVGVAMGASGTDFAQAMSDLVLEADHPAALLGAIAEGRTVYRNIKKSVHYLLSTNLSEVLLMAAGAGLGRSDPLSPMALLWTNLATDIAPAIALGLEPAEADVLTRRSRSAGQGLLERGDRSTLIGDAALLAAAGLAAFVYGLLRHGPGASAQTVCFTTLNLAQLLHAWSIRSPLPIGSAQRRANPLLDGVVIATLAANAAAVFVPAIRRLIGGGPIAAIDAVVAMLAGSLPLLLREAGKHLKPAAHESAA